MMQDILDKLKILDYETKFAEEQMSSKLLHQAYFSIPHPKPNEQFYYFTSLFSWLMRLNHLTFQRPEQFDDPNTTVANMMEAMKRARLSVDYPMQKVKQGYGEAVCVVLSLLCDAALEKAGFKIGTPVYPTDNYPEEAPVDEDEEVSADIADTVAAVDDDDDDDEMYTVAPEKQKQEVRENKIMESSIDPNAWKVEVENVAPLLRMRVEVDNKEWRTHLEMTKELQEGIHAKVPGTKEQLTKLSGTISAAVEQISTREKYINSQYKNLVDEYREMQEQLQEVSKRYDERNRDVSDLTNELTRISENLEVIRSQMDERGESMKDTGPLVRLKDAMKKLRKDIKDMDLRVGTVSHSLLHIKMAQELNKHEDNNAKASNDDDDY